jgi:uncharacterized protein (TIGR03083 family)
MVSAMTHDPRAGWLAFDVYLRLIRADSERFAEVGRLGLDAAVPTCPDWTVSDLLVHTAHVYLHKVAWLRSGSRPDPWPPPEVEGREPLGLFDEATSTLLSELESRNPNDPAETFWEPEQSVGFWYRRMALEVAVHRYDAELAHDVPTAIDGPLATDGIDEALRVMLGGAWWTKFDTAEPLDNRVRVTSGGRSWTVTADLRSVTVVEGDTDDVPAEIAGAPEDVFLWAWGRRGADSLAVTGDQELAAGFRRRLAETMG